jgi:putative thioredoxin
MENFIRDVTSASFESQVVEASRAVPVVVDFWASWCAPCRALKPILEKLSGEYGGQFILARLDTDKEQEVAARFGIRGIPSVKAFVDGKVKAEFSGAIPESAVRSFLERVIPTPVEKLRLQASQAVREGDFEVAEGRLHEALKLDPASVPARLDLVDLLIARQAYSEADLELQRVPGRERDERAEQFAAAIEFWKKGQSLAPAAELEAALAKSPGDLELRFRVAERHIADRSYDAALAHLLEIVRAERGALRDRARKTMVDVFNLAGDQADMVATYRRMLASALY